MANRTPWVQLLVKLGLATAGTATLVGIAYHFWNKNRQKEMRKKFLFGSVEAEIEESEKRLKQSTIRKYLEEQAAGGNAEKNGVGAKKKADLEEAEKSPQSRVVTINVVIPREHNRGFIGPQGSNIQKIQRDTNTQINCQRETLDNGDRVYMIHGTSADVRMAELQIKKYIMSQPIHRTVTIQVPESAFGRVIGRNGENIRTIQDQSGAKVTSDQKEGDMDSSESQPAGTRMKLMLVRGTDEQIEMANAMIQEKIELEATFRRSITAATTGRTRRRGPPGTPEVLPVRSIVAEMSASNNLRIRRDGSMEVFVSCVYNPNCFWIQVVGDDSMELDKLCLAMTEYYTSPQSKLNEAVTLGVGDIVAASFDDEKYYRGRILEINNEEATVVYVDYGDKRKLPISKLHQIKTEYLRLRFQAIEVTLNLDYQEDWSDAIIGEFCKLTHCANWKIMTAKVKEYLTEEDENRDIIWIELFDNTKNLNIGDEILRRLGIGVRVEAGSEESESRDVEDTEASVGVQNDVPVNGASLDQNTASDTVPIVPSPN